MTSWSIFSKEPNLKAYFKDMCVEAAFDISALEKLPDHESKLCKIKRDLHVKLYREGAQYKIKGNKEALERAAKILASKLDESEKIVIRGIENADIVTSFLSGEKWGAIDQCSQVKKLNKKFDICFFSMFISKNSSQVFEKLLDLHCEMQVESIDRSELKVSMKGPTEYVDSIFKFIDGEYRAVQHSVRRDVFDMNIRNKHKFMDVVQSKLEPTFMIFQGTYFFVVCSKEQAKNQESVMQRRIDSCVKEAGGRTTRLDPKATLDQICASEVSTSKQRCDDIPKASAQNRPEPPGVTVKLDRNNIEYLTQIAWQRVVATASDYSVVPTITEAGIRLEPMRRNFEDDSKMINAKLNDFLKSLTTQTIVIGTKQAMNVRTMERITTEAKNNQVLLTFQQNKPGKLTMRGTEDSLESLVKYVKVLLDISTEPCTVGSRVVDTKENTTPTQESLGGHTSKQTAEQRHGERRLVYGSQKIPAHGQHHDPLETQASGGDAPNTNLLYRTVYQHTGSGITIHCGVEDITRLHVDCIVNAANEELKHIGGVAYAISKAAGPELDKESRRYIGQHGLLEIAAVCVTTAGYMPCQKVLHTVGPMWSQYRHKQECVDQLQSAFYNCLQEADKLNMTSIAFPAISSGIFGVPINYVSQAACEAICIFCVSADNSKMKDIYLVDIATDTIDSFNSMLSNYASRGVFTPFHL